MNANNMILEKAQPLYLRIYDVLKNLIVNGDISPGEEMIETKLAAQLGVSRTPIRDAIRQLTKDGLVVPQENGAAKVFSPTVFDVAEIYITRAALESQAAAIVSNRIDEAFIQELQEIIKKSEEAYLNDDLKGMVQSNTDFHEKIIHFSENKNLIRNIQTMHMQIMQVRRTSLAKFEHRSTSYKEHISIIETLRGGNPVEIHQIISSHILKAGCRVIEQLGVPEKPSPSILYLLKYKEGLD